MGRKGEGGGGVGNDFIYDCQCNKNIETHTICQSDKKEYPSISQAKFSFLAYEHSQGYYCAINCLSLSVISLTWQLFIYTGRLCIHP